MSSDLDFDLSKSPRIKEVEAEILAEQARHALTIDGQGQRPRVNLYPPATTDPSRLPKIDVSPPPTPDEDAGFTDKIAGKVYPGLGHIGPTDQSNRWRLDYLDTGHCGKSTKFGMCFKMHWR